MAQTGSLVLSSGTTTPGGTASLNLTFTPAGGSQPAGLQWTFSYAATDIVSVSAVTGAAATAAGKSVTCAGTSGSYTCVAAGTNANTIGSGEVAALTVTLAPSTTSTTIGVVGTLGATVAGGTYATSGTGGTVTVSGGTTYHVISLSCNPASLQGSGSSTCTAGIDNPAPAGGLTVTLSSDNQYLTVPASVTIPSGATAGSFSANTTGVTTNQTANITATYNTSSQSSAISLVASTSMSISSLVCNPTALGSGASGSCTVTLTKAAGPGGVVVSLSSTGLSELTVPSSVTVPATATAGGFVISTGTLGVNQSGPLTASYGGSSQTVNLTLTAVLSISSLACNPSTLGLSSTATCTVTLSGSAPAGGVIVALSTTLGNVAVPRVLTVPGGSPTSTFNVTTFSFSSNQTGSVTASYNGSQSATLNLALTQNVTVSQLQCNPSTLGPNASSSCTVSLSAPAPAGGAAVTLTDSGLSALTVPANVQVTAGSTSGPFTISTGALTSDQNGTLTATYNSSSRTANMSLAASTVVSSLQCNPTTLGANSSSSCTVTLSKAAPAGGVVVALSTSGLSSMTVPATVQVTAGSTAGPFTASTGAVGTDQSGALTATYNSSSQTANMNLVAATVISSLQCNPTTLGANASSSCSVTLSKAAPAGGIVVTLSTSGLSALAVPASVQVTAGSTTGPFSVSTGALTADQNGALTASYNSSAQSVNLSLAAAVVISSLQCNPTTLGPNATANCTVTLSKAAPTGGIAVVISSSGLSALTVPATVLVAAGATAGSFTPSTGALFSDQNGTLTVTYNGSSQTVNMSLAAAVVISSLQCNPTTLGANATSNCSVTMSKAAPAGGLVVALTGIGLPGLIAPSSVTVAGGSITASFTVSTGALGANQSGTLKATYNTSSQSIAFTLSAATVISSLQCSSTTLGSHATSNCTVTFSAVVNADAAVALSTTLPGVAVPRVAMVSAGTATGAFTITTFTNASTATGVVTATYNSSAQSLTFTVTP